MLIKSIVAALCIALPVQAQDAPAPAPKAASPVASAFKVTFDSSLQATPYTGRVYVTLNTNLKSEPRFNMTNWFQKNPVFALEVKDIAPGASVEISADCLAYPKPLAETEPGEYAAQAIARRNYNSAHIGVAENDLYSEPVTVTVKPGETGIIELKLSKVVPATPFPESDRVKEFTMVSPSLSKFYGQEVKVKAGVILPVGWTDDAGQKYPTVYFIGGFGGDHRLATMGGLPKSAEKCLVIVPDATCPLGHSVLADSANNGPRGAAFVDELVPAVEAKYHGAGDRADLRVISGISSGGWASLWVMLHYPDQFAGCWSYSPDPVDFRDFQRINLYHDHANMYKDEDGKPRPLARNGDKVAVWYEDFCKQEWVMGPGGQIHSFEAVFSPKGEDGKPKPLFDRKTGDVNHEVALAWDAYDIRLYIERNWSTLGPKISQKLHIYAGELDNFYLDGAARLLADSLNKVEPGADIHIVKGMGHTIQRPSFDVMFRVLNEKVNPSPPDVTVGDPKNPGPH